MDIIRDIENFAPLCPQEQRDKTGILRFLAGHPDAFDRENLTAHMTASAWVRPSLPFRNARRVYSPGAAGWAPAARQASTRRRATALPP